MPTIKRFEDLETWQEARRLSQEAYPVMDNIAEGFERDGNREFIQFLSTAKSSAGETRSQLYRVFDNGYIDEKEMLKLVSEYETLSRRIANFMNYLNKKDFKGNKFKENRPEA